MEIPYLGDHGLAWFDKEWPFQGDEIRLQVTSTWSPDGFLSLNTKSLSAVAGFAGNAANLRAVRSVIPQLLLTKQDDRWLLLTRHITTGEFMTSVPEVLEPQDYENNRVLRGACVEIIVGEPETKDSRLTWDDGNGVERGLVLHGDATLRRVFCGLAHWGFLQSAHLLSILERFPMFVNVIDPSGLSKLKEYLLGINPTKTETLPIDPDNREITAPLGEDSRGASKSLDKLPPLNKTDGKWALANSEKIRELGWETGSLRTKRGKLSSSSRPAIKSKDENSGIDDSGFGWRKESLQVVWYYLPWMTKNNKLKKKEGRQQYGTNVNRG